ncbi:MAG TPA: hypothetical protein VGT05_04470 [Patescibacteria group bacterium]|nr:hypothetical protein [Patescibacteria group bacterium]
MKKKTSNLKRANAFFSVKSGKTISILSLFLIIVALPLTMFQLQKKVILQQHAAGSVPSYGQGIYESCTSWGTADPNGCKPRLLKISQGGVRLVVNYDQLWGDAAGMEDYLNYANSLGMKVIFSMSDSALWNGTNLLTYYKGLAATCVRPDNTACQNNTDFITYVVNLVKNNPALWGYYVEEVQPANHDALKTFTDLVHQLDPSHPRLNIETTENTGGGATGATSILTTFQDTADVIGVDYYPVGSWGAGESVPQTASIAAAVQAVANKYGKQSAMTLQSFSWSEYPNEAWRCPGVTTCPYPVLSDLETMLNLTLQNASPRLVLWYSNFDVLKSDNPTQHWSDLTTAINSTPTPTSAPTNTPTPTPTPVNTIVAQDTFQRPNQTYWGKASDGLTWGGSVSSSNVFSIKNDTGQEYNASNKTYIGVLGPSVTDAEVLATVKSSAFSSGNTVGLVLRETNTNNYYYTFLNGSQLVIKKIVAGTTKVLTSAAFTTIKNTFYTIRFRIIGSTLYAKVWQVGMIEPSGWTTTPVTDTSLSGSGHAGIRTGEQSGVTINYTFFQATQQP